MTTGALSVAQPTEKHPGTSTRLLWINIEEEEEEEAAVELLTVYRQDTKLLVLRLSTW